MKPNRISLLAAIAPVLLDGGARLKAARGERGIAMPVTPRVKGPGRNDPCPCGKGKKFKKCCLPKQDQILEAYRNGHLTRVGDAPGGNVFSLDSVSGQVDGVAREVHQRDGLHGAGSESDQRIGQDQGRSNADV